MNGTECTRAGTVLRNWKLVDAGWWAPVVVFLCGMFSGHIWWRFKQGRPIGVVIYPRVLLSALIWFGPNLLISMFTIVMILTSVALILYEIPFRLLTLAASSVCATSPLGTIQQPRPPEGI